MTPTKPKIDRWWLILTNMLLCFLPVLSRADDVEGWRKPLREKEKLLEANILHRHNILGLYPSMVQIPPAGQKMDITTATPFSDVVHSVAWTSHYLAGACYRYAWLRDNGGSAEEVDQARRRADELFEAVYRCQRVTGKRGLLARGYLIGTGPTFDERRAAAHRDDWHQGHVDGYDLRFCAAPSHHIYSAATMGMGFYYELAAQGEQKRRAREAIDALVSWWVDNDYKIAGYNENSRPPFSILGYTDGRTLNTRVMMAVSAARIAYHVTGKAKFKRAFEDLVGRYGVRDLKQFRTAKGYDDAHHVFAHLDLLHRVETNKQLRAAYAIVADGLWGDHYKDEGHSHFTFIYYHLRPEAPGKAQALKNALFTLATWPTDMTIQPIMSSLDPSMKPPYPVYATGWDNEFIWKGNLLRPDSHTSRIATQIIVSPQSPHVAAVADPSGHLYVTHDGGASEGGWRCVSDRLRSPVRGAAFGPRTRIMAVACDDGYYITQTGGDEWRRLPLETNSTPTSVQFDPGNPDILFAMTARSIHRSLDYGPELVGNAWVDVGSRLPRGISLQFTIVPSGSDGESRIYARNGFRLFYKLSDAAGWQMSQLGVGRYGESLDIRHSVLAFNRAGQRMARGTPVCLYTAWFVGPSVLTPRQR